MKVKKKIVLTIVFLLTFLSYFNITYAKYFTVNQKLNFQINYDMKPIIVVQNSKNSVYLTDETYSTSENVKVSFYSDIQITSARYWFNANNKSFNGTSYEFNNETILSKDGWYKIVVTDILGNTNTVTILLDTTAPNITIKYYKKSQIY